ncbi:MAG: 2,3-bisphosphoglycerate-independent phosphoglycerate mutase [Actinomycetota bacterium]|nr:2,3-bisphosphoglycerate-independent phosphoglycerate mutase [Actinomycetota bacterium]
MDMRLLSGLSIPTDTKVILLVMDGLGGLPHPETGLTELETARTPNLDALARDSICGLIHAVAPGITPGSGPGHLSLFGYDPLRFDVGRGVLSALGVGLKLEPDDLAARVNFCTVEEGKVVDRRAGRIATEEGKRLCKKLAGISLDGVDITIVAEKEHRAALVLRGSGLSQEISDTDPQRNGLPLQCCRSLHGADESAAKTAYMVNAFLDKAAEVLAEDHPANMIITRGFSKLPEIPCITDLYHIKAGAIATYPMYRAVARLVGMKLIDTGSALSDEVDALFEAWHDYDYFFFHYKYTDSRGEDGDFDSKVACIEEVDTVVPRILELEPDVLAITGDHSTPAILEMHSWHPSPLLLNSRWERRDDSEVFGESACARGGLGIFQARDLMALMLANSLRLNKYGA